jgi:hypothetical protein
MALTCFYSASPVGASANPSLDDAPAGALRPTSDRDLDVQNIDVSCSAGDVIGQCVDETLSGWDPPLLSGNRSSATAIQPEPPPSPEEPEPMK